MKINQTIIIIIGICFLLSTAGALADEEIRRTTDEAPIDHNADEGERGLEEPVIAPEPYVEDEETDPFPEGDVVGEDLPDDIPHILDVSNGEYDPNIAFGTTDDSGGSSEKHTGALPVAIGVCIAGSLLLGFLIVKRRQIP